MKIAQHFSAGTKSKISNKSVKRTAEVSRESLIINFRRGHIDLVSYFNRPLHGRIRVSKRTPSDKSLGYFQIVRSADEARFL